MPQHMAVSAKELPILRSLRKFGKLYVEIEIVSFLLDRGERVHHFVSCLMAACAAANSAES